jgi:hypothetical protein
LGKLVEAGREKVGRNKQTTIIVVDSKSAQNADATEEKGFFKLHIGVDVLGLPSANVTDRNGAIEMVSNYKNVTSNLDFVLKVLVDSGYTGDKFSDAIKDLIGA